MQKHDTDSGGELRALRSAEKERAALEGPTDYSTVRAGTHRFIGASHISGVTGLTVPPLSQ